MCRGERRHACGTVRPMRRTFPTHRSPWPMARDCGISAQRASPPRFRRGVSGTTLPQRLRTSRRRARRSRIAPERRPWSSARTQSSATAPRPGSGASTASATASSTSYLPLETFTHPRTPSVAPGPEIRAGQRDLNSTDWVIVARGPRHHSAAYGARPRLPSLPDATRSPRSTPCARARALTAAELVASLRQLRRPPRRRPAARARAAGRRRAPSHRASRGPASRCTTTDLPRPEVNWWVVVDGVPTYRLDLAYPHAKVAIEYDGEEFHSSARGQAGRRDVAGWLERHGWTVIVVDKNSFTDEALDHWIERGTTSARDAQRPPAATGTAILAATRRPGPQLDGSPRRNSTRQGRAARMAAREAGRPVNCSNWRAAWWTSRSRPVTSTRSGGRPAVEHRPGERGRPRVVDDLEHHGYVRAPVDQVVGLGGGRDGGDHDVADHRRRRAATATSTSGAAGCRRRAATASAARAGSRTSSRMRAGAQVGQGQAGRGRGGSPAQDGRPTAHRHRQRSRSAAAAPGTSVLSACHRPSVVHQRVGGARQRAPSARPRRRASAASRLSGAVTDSPRHDGVEPVHERRQPAGRHRGARRTPSPARTRRTPPGAAPATASARSGRPALRTHGEPHRDQQRSDWVSQYSCSSALNVQELVVAVGELGLAGLEVDGHVEEPGPVLGVERGLDRRRRPAPRSGRAAGPCCV